MTPPDRSARDPGRYALIPKVTLMSLNDRLSNVERILLQIQSNQTPKWVKAGGWTTIVGSVLAVAVKILVTGAP